MLFGIAPLLEVSERIVLFAEDGAEGGDVGLGGGVAFEVDMGEGVCAFDVAIGGDGSAGFVFEGPLLFTAAWYSD